MRKLNKEGFDRLYDMACHSWKMRLLQECKSLLVEDEVYINEELLKAALNDADSAQSEIILDVLSNTCGANRWYRDADGDVFFVTEWLNSYTARGYGMCHGTWVHRESNSDGSYGFRKGFREATRKEIVEMLFKQIELRIPTTPTKIRYIDTGLSTLFGRGMNYNMKDNVVYASECKDALFSDGEFAEVIESVDITMQELIEELGYVPNIVS